MNYEQAYFNLIDKHGSETKPDDGEYYERHHIVPKTMGGDDSPNNLTYLTARCHLLAHWLLMNAYDTAGLRMAYATMCTRDGIRLTPKMYAIARVAMSGANSPVRRAVFTPLGEFPTVAAAAAAHGVSKAIISKKCKSDSMLHQGYGYVGVKNTEKVVESQHGKHLRKAVVTPLGMFESTREAGIAHDIHHSTIAKRVRRGDAGYHYVP